MIKLIFSLLTLAIAASAQKAVLDTSGEPLRRGVQYYIKPAITDNGGRFTLVSRNEQCPLFVGQEPTSLGSGLPVKFEPFFEDNDTVIEEVDFKVSFVASTVCLTATTWKLDSELISVGSNEVSELNYFHISANSVDKTYFIGWCPNEFCPECNWLRCGDVGIVEEDGKRLLAWDGRPPLPVVFERA